PTRRADRAHPPDNPVLLCTRGLPGCGPDPESHYDAESATRATPQASPNTTPHRSSTRRQRSPHPHPHTGRTSPDGQGSDADAAPTPPRTSPHPTDRPPDRGATTTSREHPAHQDYRYATA